MADVIHIVKGFSPWQPDADAELAKTYQYYEIPTAGIIDQHGTRFFFFCVDGAEDSVSLWFYSWISPALEDAIDAADSESFFEVAEFDGPSTMALAVEGLGIVVDVVLEELNTESVQAAYQALKEQLQSWVNAADELDPEPLPSLA